MKLIITIALLLFSLLSSAQSDSLFDVWNNKTLEDSIRLKASGKFTLTILQNHPDSCENLAV